MTSWVNGQMTDKVKTTDRGLLYGDGFFTTIRVRNKQLEHWALHKERIGFSIQRLNFPEINMQQLEQEVNEVITSQEEASGVIRLTITRGSGPRGYRAPSNPEVQRIISWSSGIPADYSEGVELTICETPFSINSALAGIKHLNRLEQVLAQDEIPTHCFDGIMLADDLVVGGSKSNIYFYHNDLWLTPSVEVAGVNGTVRRWLLETCNDVQQSIYGLEILSKAEHCMVSNALHGLIPVTKIGQHRYDVSPGIADLNTQYQQSSN